MAHSERFTIKENNRDQILAYIRSFRSARGYSPSYREIAEGTGIRSTSTISRHIHELAGDGVLETARRRPRALSLRIDGTAPVPELHIDLGHPAR